MAARWIVRAGTLAAVAVMGSAAPQAWAGGATIGPDPGFGSSGAATVSFPAPAGAASVTGDSSVRDIVRQPDGKLLVAGNASGKDASGSLVSELCVARLNADGSADTTFGSGGSRCMTPTNDASDTPYALAREADNGDVVLAGTSTDNATFTTSVVLIRLDSSGTPDAGFGTGGMVAKAASTDISSPVGLALLPDDRLLVAYGSSVAVRRFKTDGSLDSTYGSSGTAATPLGSSVSTVPMVLQDDQSLVLGGTQAAGPAGPKIAVSRLTPSGSADTSFGTNGTTALPSGSGNYDYPYALALQDGKVLVSGTSSQAGGGYKALEARLTSGGVLDDSFGSAGILLVSPPSGSGNLYGGPIAFDPDPDILATDQTDNSLQIEVGDPLSGQIHDIWSLVEFVVFSSVGQFTGGNGGHLFVAGARSTGSTQTATIEEIDYTPSGATTTTTPATTTTTGSGPGSATTPPPEPAVNCSDSLIRCADLSADADVSTAAGFGVKGLTSGDTGVLFVTTSNLGPAAAHCELTLTMAATNRQFTEPCASEALRPGGASFIRDTFTAPTVALSRVFRLTVEVSPTDAFDPKPANNKTTTFFDVFARAAQAPTVEKVTPREVDGLVLDRDTFRPHKRSVSPVRVVRVAIMDAHPGRCRWVRSLRARFTAAARQCAAPVWLRARGTRHWRLRLARRLPKGSYRVLVQIIDVSGARSSLQHGGRPVARLIVRR